MAKLKIRFEVDGTMHDVLLFISGTLLNPKELIGKCFIAFSYFIIAIIASRLIHFLVRRFSKHPLLIDRTTATLVGLFLRVGSFFVAALAYAYTVPAFYEAGAGLIASAGVLSLVLGIAAQETLGNLIAGVTLLFYRPFAIGDVVIISTPTGSETGTVKEITLGYTKIVIDDERWIIAPNSSIVSNVLIRIKSKS